MVTKKIFLASSLELKKDREQFEILINRKNKDWVDRGVFLKLVVWEDFLDAVSKTRLQDEYNKAIRECDIFVMLFCTKVGQYTGEEFETAFGQFMSTNKPFIFTYFKDTEISTGSANKNDLMSLWAFQAKLKALGHFYTVYKNIDALQLHFTQQLDKLATIGFIELKFDTSDAAALASIANQANLTGSGAIAQGSAAIAVGPSGVFVGGKNSGNINTGTQTKTDTGGDKITRGISPEDLDSVFASLLAAVVQHSAVDTHATAAKRVGELKTEVAKGNKADDSKMRKIVEGLVAMVPGAVGAVVDTFSTPILGGIVGPATKFVLDKLKTSS